MKEKTKKILKVIFSFVTEIIRHFTVCKKKEEDSLSKGD